MTSARKHPVAAVWFAAILVVLGGYVLVFRIAEGRVDDRISANALRIAQLRASETQLADRPRLETERARLRSVLHGVDSGRDATHLVAAFVRGAAREAALHHTAITAIAATDRLGPPPPAKAAGAATPPAPDADPLDMLPLDVTVDGRYADVLATIRRLSRMPVLAVVDVTSLARKNADSADVTLSAALHVTLAHLTLRPPVYARARPE